MNLSRNILSWLFIAALTFFAVTALGQGQGFVHTYQPASSSARTLVQASDGGYLLAGEVTSTGNIFLQKTNAVGAPVWSNNTLTGRAISACRASDGGFVVLSENFSQGGVLKNRVLKLSDSGSIVWQNVVDNPFLPNGLRKIIATADGGFLAAGDTRDAQLKQDIWLVKLAGNGDILWSESFGNAGFNEQVSGLVELPGGFVAISGAGVHNGDRDLFLAKADPAGNLVWQQWYDKSATQHARDLLLASDGGLVLLGETYGTDPTTIDFLKTDADGMEIFFRQHFPWPTSQLNNLVIVSSFVRDAADNFFVAGYLSASTFIGDTVGAGIFLLKADAVGNFEWAKDLGYDEIPYQIINTSDNKFAICGGVDSPSAFLIKANEQGEIYTNKISGNVYHDENDNCSKDTGEPALTDFIVKAENQFGQTFFKNAAPDGSFLMPVSEGDFEISVMAAYGSQSLWQSCDTQVVSVTGTYQTVQAAPLGIRSLADCPLMFVDIAAPFLRRCFSNTFNVNYCNHGNVTATDVSVELTLSSSLLEYEASSIPLVGQNGNTLTFDLPDVEPNACGSFWVKFVVNCDAELGDVLCVEAHIFPDSFCGVPDPLWDGSNLEVFGSCNGEVKFTVKNTGFDMTSVVDYVIVEDQIMYMQGQLQLGASEDTIIAVPNPSGGPYYLQTSQTPGHPSLSEPSAIVSPCGGAANSSALQFPNSEEPYLAVHCDEVVGSYDPNDKRGFPLGWKDAHYVERNQELEYMIRFQNTGTDTAFTVVVRDTISYLLDVASVRPGASSHPYAFQVSGEGVLTFRFDNILLVDSATNEPASHGYVLFNIAQQPDLPLGTIIENDAAIYFDYNEPIITNTWVYTVGKPFTTFIKNPPASGVDLQIFPNPFSEQTLFRLNGVAENTSIRLSVINAQGRLEREEVFTGTEYLFQNNGLSAGVYFFKMEENGRLLASGKVVVKSN
jgi:uncharacterized repeat protein (TIGR01451 family)